MSHHVADVRDAARMDVVFEAQQISLYDGTVEGLNLPEVNARSVQFHPEAGPGPHDGWPLLEGWVQELIDAKA